MNNEFNRFHSYAQLVVRRQVDGTYEIKYYHEGSTFEWRGTDLKAAVALASQKIAELFLNP